ncbi:g199 [Coccomyxa elongata]
MQVRAQASLSGQASCSNSKLQPVTNTRSFQIRPSRAIQHVGRIQRHSTIVRAEDGDKSGVSAVVEKVKNALPALEDIVDENILDYCTLDKKGSRPTSKKTLGEKEQEFLEALRAFYYEEAPTMSNEEFDNLKEELLWAGSKVAVLSSTEQRFLEASLAFQAGKPIVSDEEYDALKDSLRKKNSKVVQQGPRCSIRSRRIYSDATPDYLKMTLLNLPAAVLTLVVLFSIDDLTGFEITKLVELPEPFGIFVVWGFVLPLTYIVSSSLTNLVLKDFLILKGPCPNCLTETQTYFGDIFTVKGSRDTNLVECSNCKAKITVNAAKRSMIISEMPGSGPPAASKKQPSTA